MKHLKDNLNDLQYGFTKVDLQNSINITVKWPHHINYDRSLPTDLIITDFAKAFDVAPHHRLLYKLNWYGIRGTISQWIQSFSSDHSQRVIIVKSSLTHVTSGIPQEQYLVQYLYLVYISDSICHSLRLFADNCLPYKIIQSPHDAIDLQQGLLAMQ